LLNEQYRKVQFNKFLQTLEQPSLLVPVDKENLHANFDGKRQDLASPLKKERRPFADLTGQESFKSQGPEAEKFEGRHPKVPRLNLPLLKEPDEQASGHGCGEDTASLPQNSVLAQSQRCQT